MGNRFKASGLYCVSRACLHRYESGNQLCGGGQVDLYMTFNENSNSFPPKNRVIRGAPTKKKHYNAEVLIYPNKSINSVVYHLDDLDVSTKK